MKHLKIILVAVVLIFGMSFVTTQSNIAHIDTEVLKDGMPAMKSAKAELERLTNTYQYEIQKMTLEYQTKVKKFDAEAETKTKEVNNARVQEALEMEQNILEFKNSAQQVLQKKETELLTPILKRAKDAVIKVANNQGIDYVFDSSPGLGVIHAKGKDLLADVRSELGI